MNYIMTGNSGLIGEYLKKRLDKDGHNNILTIDQREGFNILSVKGLKLNPITQPVDILYHLAAHCKINEGTMNPELPHINNAIGTFEVLEFCRKNNIKKIMNFSSSRVLSKEKNPYTASKQYGENLCEAYRQCYGIDYIIVRPSTVYGPCHDITSRLMTNWCINALKGKELPIYGKDDKTLDFTYVDDFVDGIILLTEKWDIAKNKAYNISGHQETKLTGLADIIEKNIGKRVSLKYYAPEIAQPQKVKVDISDIQKLGYEPKISLEEGVKRVINFYKTEGRKWIE